MMFQQWYPSSSEVITNFWGMLILYYYLRIAHARNDSGSFQRMRRDSRRVHTRTSTHHAHNEQPITFERTPIDKTTTHQNTLLIRYPHTFEFPRISQYLHPSFVWVGHVVVLCLGFAFLFQLDWSLYHLVFCSRLRQSITRLNRS